MSFCTGIALDGNGGLGHGGESGVGGDEPLTFITHVIDTKGRPAAKYMVCEVTLTGPDGSHEVQVGENDGGNFTCSYAALQKYILFSSSNRFCGSSHAIFFLVPFFCVRMRVHFSYFLGT